jgi:hypothetical protein
VPVRPRDDAEGLVDLLWAAVAVGR